MVYYITQDSPWSHSCSCSFLLLFKLSSLQWDTYSSKSSETCSHPLQNRGGGNRIFASNPPSDRLLGIFSSSAFCPYTTTKLRQLRMASKLQVYNPWSFANPATSHKAPLVASCLTVALTVPLYSAAEAAEDIIFPF